ncbi:MAG: hypothetical protein FJ224_11355 [Lentisphaerae bacterium]|nr:hypothetical protein [Lentisphaerota bacterium]
MIRWFHRLAIMAAVWAAFAPGLGGVFVLDDYTVILEAPHVRSLSLPPRMARSLVDLSFAVQHAAAGGFRAADFRMLNLLLHAATALFLYGVVRRTLLLDGMPGKCRGAASNAAFFTALLWSVHPIQSRAVTYVCQRYEIAASLCLLAALYAFIRSTASRNPSGWRVVSVLACWVGLGAKEVIIAAPLVIAAYDLLFVGRGWRTVLQRRLYYAAMMAAWIPALADLVSLRRAGVSGVVTEPMFTATEYLLSQPGVILHYLRLVFAPWPIVLDYNWPAARGLVEIVPPAVAVGGVLIAGVAGLIRLRRMALPVVAFFLILAPSSSILPLDDLMFLHRMYLPLAAVLAPAAVAAAARCAAPDAGFRRVLCRLAGGCVVLGLCAVTRGLNNEFRSETAFWERNVAIRPSAWRARNALAVALCEDGRSEEALPHFAYVVRHATGAGFFAAPPPRPPCPVRVADQSERYARYRALANLGTACVGLGRKELAATAWAWALRVEPYADAVIGSLRGLLVEEGVPEPDADRDLSRRVWSCPGDLDGLLRFCDEAGGAWRSPSGFGERRRRAKHDSGPAEHTAGPDM